MGTWTIGADLSLARGVSQSGYTDRNLGPEQFQLAVEGGRPVFAPAALINPGSGVVSLAASRKDTRFGQVLLLDSRLGSKSAGITLSANGITRGGMSVQGSYTLSRSRDQSSASEGGGQRGGKEGEGGKGELGCLKKMRDFISASFSGRSLMLVFCR